MHSCATNLSLMPCPPPSPITPFVLARRNQSFKPELFFSFQHLRSQSVAHGRQVMLQLQRVNVAFLYQAPTAAFFLYYLVPFAAYAKLFVNVKGSWGWRQPLKCNLQLDARLHYRVGRLLVHVMIMMM